MKNRKHIESPEKNRTITFQAVVPFFGTVDQANAAGEKMLKELRLQGFDAQEWNWEVSL